MLHWLAENLATVLISLALLALLIFILRGMVRRKKAGKCSCGCSCGSCSECGSCSHK